MKHPDCTRKGRWKTGQTVVVTNNGRPAVIAYQVRAYPGWYRVVYTDAKGGRALRREHELQQP